MDTTPTTQTSPTGLLEVEASPLLRARSWYEDALASGPRDLRSAFTLCTATRWGQPNGRMLLADRLDLEGLTFYGQTRSNKGDELRTNGVAAAVFWWPEQGRQLRLRGNVSRVTDAEADARWARRPRLHRAGSTVSRQSEVMDGPRVRFLLTVAKIAMRPELPRPQSWVGWRLRPDEVEFFEMGLSRSHRRTRHQRNGASWVSWELYP